MQRETDREAYLILMRATERALRILIAAQQQCEELYLAAGEHAENGTDHVH